MAFVQPFTSINPRRPRRQPTRLVRTDQPSKIYAAALRTSDTIELPIAARTETNLRNSHLGYAITWYGIACALIGVYLAFHHQAGRLRFGRDAGASDE